MKLSLLFVLPFCLATLTLGAGCSHAADTAAQRSANTAEGVGDSYVLPQGAGTKDGSSWANARDGAALQKAWDALAPGGTLWVGSGEYPGARLTLAGGGAAGKPKTLAGKDTGGGLPVFTSDFDKNNTEKTGGIFISAAKGADYWAVQDIAVRGYSVGLASRDGGHEGVRIRNFDVTDCREGMSLSGGGTYADPELASHDWEISDCNFKNFTKRGIRFKNGNYDFKIINCVADAGGKAWATEPFHIGFSLEGPGAHKEITAGPSEHDITFINCVAQNSYDDSRRYWNGDGYCAEHHVKNLQFLHCFAFDNTDGGWDLKAENVRFENCVGIGNKKNFRLWSQTNTMVNTLSAFSVWPGGTGGHAGLWTNGAVAIDRSTFLDGDITPDAGAKVTVSNSIIAHTKTRPSATPEETARLTLRNTVLWDEAAGQGGNPGFVAPVSSWDGQGDAFNSKLGPARGFVNVAATMPPFTRTLLVPGVRAATSHAASAKGAAPLATAPKTPEQLAAESAMQPQIQNGGFETGLDGWTKAKAPIWQIKTGNAPQGRKYASISTENRSEAQARLTGLVAGEKYTLTFQSRGNTSKDARIIVRGGPGNEYLARGTPSDLPAWTTKALTFTAPAAEVTLQISVRSAGSFDLDDFVIRRAG